MGVDAQVAAAYSTRPLSSAQLGEVSEWLKEHAWKVCIPQGIEGSNPSLTAILTPVIAGITSSVGQSWGKMPVFMAH